MKRKSWWCLIILVGLVTAVGCAKKDIPSSDERKENVPKKSEPGLVYDAAAVSRILGLPCESNDPVPQANDGEVVVYYGGWDLKTLHTSTAGKESMFVDHCEGYEWKAEPGYYRLLLRVPGSNKKIWNEQLRHLATNFDPAWQPAPVCIAATAVLVHLTESGCNLLGGYNFLEGVNWCRCAEVLPDYYRVQIRVRYSRLFVSSLRDDSSEDYIWLSAARKVP